MKKSMLLICILSVMLFSCDKIKEAITVPVNTTLKVDVPISVAVTKSLNLNDKAGTSYPFSTEKVLDLTSNTDIASYINQLKSADISKVTVTFLNLMGTQEISTLNVSVAGVSGPVLSLTGITATVNNPITPIITPAIQAQLDLVEAKLIADKKITITVSGTTNAAPLTLIAKLAFDTKFTYQPLN